MSKDNGGPAFPVPEQHYVRHFDAEENLTGSSESNATDEASAWDGMWLRDYFAAKSLVGLTGSIVDVDGNPVRAACLNRQGKLVFNIDPDQLAALAYELAGAMLAERAK